MEENRESSSQMKRTNIFGFLIFFLSLFTGLCIGLLIGLFVLGWWIFPVQWVDASPPDLHHSYQLKYVDMIVTEYTILNDLNLAKDKLSPWDDEEAMQLLDEVRINALNTGDNDRAQEVLFMIETYEISEDTLNEP